MAQRRFVQCDVFSSVPPKGNGLAVIVDADGMSSSEMQAFAAWTNLAETTFILSPTDPAADYRVRIFTPGREMLFAGHPTLGSCAAWLHCGGRPKTDGKVIQECAIGLVEIDQTGKVPAFVAPSTEVRDMPGTDLERLINALGLDKAQIVNTAILNNGPEWQLLELATAQDVLDVDASRVNWPEFVGVSLLGRHASDNECDYEVRNISPSSGMTEDPITGSLNSAIAIWLQGQNRLQANLVMAQGTKMGRLGRVFIEPEANSDRVKIGGATRIVIDGTVDI